MPFCSATCAIAVEAPESKAPVSSWAPSAISFSARERATSTLVSVSAFMICSSGRPSSLRMPLVISTPRRQSWPMPACTPERGSSTPTLSGPFCARTMLNGAVPATIPAAPKPAVKLRRLSRAAFDFALRVISSPPCKPARLCADDAGFAPVLTSAKSLIRRTARPPKPASPVGRIVDVDNKFRQLHYGAETAQGGRSKAALMAGVKRKSGTVALRKTAARRRGARVVDLGVLNQRLGYFARRLQVWIFQDFISRLAAIDISPAQFSVLVVISANAGLSQAELALTLGIERARLVRLLHRLE